MLKIVIADTSFLIALQKLQLFEEIHQLYNEVYITPKIAEEFKELLPDWIQLQQPQNLQVQSVLTLDLKARKEATKLGFSITGTLGVLFKLKQKGLINSLRDKINQLITFGFRVNDKVIEEMLEQAGEV